MHQMITSLKEELSYNVVTHFIHVFVLFILYHFLYFFQFSQNKAGIQVLRRHIYCLSDTKKIIKAISE